MPRQARLPDHVVTATTHAELNRYLRAFADGHLNLLVVIGSPGVGKSQSVRRVLPPPDTCWIESHATAFGLYCAAYAPYRAKHERLYPGPSMNVFTQDALAAPYDHFDCQEIWRYRSGLVQMPVAAGPMTPPTTGGVKTPCEFVRVHAPTSTLVVKFEAVRKGVPPVIPSPVPNDPNRVLLDALVVTGVPARLADTSVPVFRTCGTYVYGLIAPLVPASEVIPGPEGPYIVSGFAASSQLDPSLFSSTIVG